MTNKSQAAYVHLFSYIDNNIISMACASYMTDFEKVMRNGIRAVCPNAQLRSCWFHFTQAVKKKSSHITNFRLLLVTNKEAMNLYYKLLAIPLLPSNAIEDSFNAIKNSALLISSCIFKDFLNYYDKQWTRKVC